jgi:hypothetical protein
MANAAGNLVGMVGSAAIAWWRVPDEGNPGGLAITAVIAAIVCAGGLAANLVWARATPGSDQSRDDR